MRTLFVFGAATTFAATVPQCNLKEGEAVALAHAPVHYQDTDSSSYVSDMITAVDYDGNWETTDNWDHLSSRSTWTSGTQAVVYASVVETCTHWFVVYMMYHPRDWSDGLVDFEHENDAEGLLLGITKDGSAHGRLDGMITRYHNDFYSFTPAGSPWTSGTEDIDGEVSFETVAGTAHPKTSQQAKGHGLQAWPYTGDFSGAAGEDGITYVPGTTSQSPPTGNDRNVQYRLVSLFDTLWFWQMASAGPYDGPWGVMQGDSSGTCGDGWFADCSDDAATSPWSWRDEGDGLPAGVLALDPVTMIDVYFDNLGNFGRDYVSNRYLEELRTGGYTDALVPYGFPGDFSLDEAYGRLDADCDGPVLPPVAI